MQAAASTNRAEAPLFQSCSAWELGHGSGHGCRNRQGWVSSEFAGSGKETRLSLQPFADNPRQTNNPQTLEFLRSRRQGTRLASVCTGAMILAASGVLDGKKATTKREVLPPEPSPLEQMRQRYPRIDVTAASLVDCDGITTSGGVSLSIDATLYIIERELGAHVARETAQIIEYSRAQETNRREFPSIVIT